MTKLYLQELVESWINGNYNHISKKIVSYRELLLKNEASKIWDRSLIQITMRLRHKSDNILRKKGKA